MLLPFLQGLISELKDHLECSVLYHLGLLSQYSAEQSRRLACAEHACEEQRKDVRALQARLANLESHVHTKSYLPPTAMTAQAGHEHLMVVEKKADEALQKADDALRKAVSCEAIAQRSKQNKELWQAKVDIMEREVSSSPEHVKTLYPLLPSL